MLLNFIKKFTNSSKNKKSNEVVKEPEVKHKLPVFHGEEHKEHAETANNIYSSLPNFIKQPLQQHNLHPRLVLGGMDQLRDYFSKASDTEKDNFRKILIKKPGVVSENPSYLMKHISTDNEFPAVIHIPVNTEFRQKNLNHILHHYLTHEIGHTLHAKGKYFSKKHGTDGHFINLEKNLLDALDSEGYHYHGRQISSISPPRNYFGRAYPTKELRMKEAVADHLSEVMRDSIKTKNFKNSLLQHVDTLRRLGKPKTAIALTRLLIDGIFKNFNLAHTPQK